MKPGCGDWVRFYQDGKLVIGVVQYVKEAESWSSHRWDVSTDVGLTSDDAILERRVSR